MAQILLRSCDFSSNELQAGLLRLGLADELLSRLAVLLDSS